MAIENVEPFDPTDLDDKILLIRSGKQHVKTEAVLAELKRVYPSLKPHNVLIIPGDWKLAAMPRQDAIMLLKGMLRRLGG
jgi:hypothetical protein